jgi:hypothetical protein
MQTHICTQRNSGGSWLQTDTWRFHSHRTIPVINAPLNMIRNHLSCKALMMVHARLNA